MGARRSHRPSFVDQLLQSSGVPIERYSFETIELMKDRVAVMSWQRQLQVAQAQLAGASLEGAEASIPKVDVHLLEVNFDGVADPQRRSRLENLPTSFVPSPEEVDEL